ncbi:MAG: hypothetical protein AB7W59_13670, partial [Acidimicrobiia bacterium]
MAERDRSVSQRTVQPGFALDITLAPAQVQAMRLIGVIGSSAQVVEELVEAELTRNRALVRV